MASPAGQRGIGDARIALCARLRSRLPEIKAAVLNRVHAIADPSDADPTYREGLHAAVSVALDYAIAVIERGEEHSPPPPPTLLDQARLAARNGVKLDTVLRRYLAGYTLLGEFLIEEVEQSDELRRAGLTPLLRGHAALFDRLLAALSEEHCREARYRLKSAECRRVERVERLLAGEQLETARLGYDFDGHHTGLIAAGPGAEDAIRGLATALSRSLLLVGHEKETVWAWLGAGRALDPEQLEHRAGEHLPADLRLAAGEPAQGLGGWRLTHRQAAAALPVALRNSRPVVRYADVALLASALQDEVLGDLTAHTLFSAART